MNTLLDWMGKADDISIMYEAGIPQNSLLLAGGSSTSVDLPVISYPIYDDLRYVENVVWENSVKKADRTDYLTAIGCGVVSGLVDVFYVGDFSLERAQAWGTEEVNKFVKKVAKLNGYKKDDLAGAVRFMEKKFPLSADEKTAEFGGPLQHHLRDFSHHFSLGGLMCSLYTQFTGNAIGTDTSGAFLKVSISETSLIGKNFEEKLLYGTVNWFFHMVSDMAGSNATAGKGAGIPGIFVSSIKEFSALPCFKDRKINEIELHTWVSKLFNGTLLGKHDENGKSLEPRRFDLRTEIGVLHEIGQQFIPVLINECLVRGFYFLRRLYEAIQGADIRTIKDFQNIKGSDLLPFNNRVIRRMITVASGVFTAVDAVDAAIHAAIKNRGINPKFFADFAVRINLVGVGRFIVACKADATLISEDILEAKTKRDAIAKEYEKAISDLQCLSLSYDQMRVLYSVEELILQDDIQTTKKDEIKSAKKKWEQGWKDRILGDLPLALDEKNCFFMEEAAVAGYLQTCPNDSWEFLLALEAMLFKPYYPIYGNDEDNVFKDLKCNSKYLTERFPEIQDCFSKKDIDSLRKTYKKATSTITGSKKSIMVGAVGTTAVVLASGGLAFTFAPAIATALVGEAAAGLSGAALVSYSLAAIGGGSLAAGGLGMVGGTAIITGGGALLGMLGGAGVSAATTLNLLSDDGYVLNECCKLLTFSKDVLIGRYNNVTAVSDIQMKISGRLATLQQQLEDGLGNEGKEKEKKLKIKIAKKSIRYLKNTSDALEKLIKSNKDQTMLALPNDNNCDC